MSAPRNEQKYFMLKLIHSGRTLTEAKAMMYAVATGLHPEYTKSGDIKDLASLEGGLHRIAMTKKVARIETMKKFFKPRTDFKSTKEESLSAFVLGWKAGLPLSWKRTGNLIRRGKENKPKPGSSKGKVGTTKVRGVKSVVTDFKRLIDALASLQQQGRTSGKSNLKSIRDVAKGIKTGATFSKKG